MHIITVCGNGIGSSLMLAGKVEELCEEEGIKADVESMDRTVLLPQIRICSLPLRSSLPSFTVTS